MVGLGPGIMMAMAAFLAVLLLLAPVMGSAVLAVGGMVWDRMRLMWGWMRRRLAGAAVRDRNRHTDQPLMSRR